MSQNTAELSLHIKITVDPEKRDVFLQALRPVFDKVALEPLNTFFEVVEDANAPGVFKLVENWNATVSYMVDVQSKKDYYAPFYAAIEPILLKPREVEIYNRMPDSAWVSLQKDLYPGRD